MMLKKILNQPLDIRKKILKVGIALILILLVLPLWFISFKKTLSNKPTESEIDPKKAQDLQAIKNMQAQLFDNIDKIKNTWVDLQRELEPTSSDAWLKHNQATPTSNI